MERILVDTYEKGEFQFRTEKMKAINDMYDWMYRTGILKRVAFCWKDYPSATTFALDIAELEPYRDQMKQADISNAEKITTWILDEDHGKCLYSGAYQLTAPMATYREVSGCVGRSFEIDLIQYSANETCIKIREIIDGHGVKAAIKNLFDGIAWLGVELGE